MAPSVWGNRAMYRLILAGLLTLALLSHAAAQDAPMQTVLQAHSAAILKSSRKTIGPAIDAVRDSGLPQARTVLQVWAAKDMWHRKADGLFFRGEKVDKSTYRLFDFDTGAEVGTFPKKELKQLKPNSGIRGLIGLALVQFQLTDPDPEKRWDALQTIQRDPEPALLAPLRASIAAETDPALAARKAELDQLLTIRFDPDERARVAAIRSVADGLNVEIRAALNPLLATRVLYQPDVPPDANVAGGVVPGTSALSVAEAYAMLLDKGQVQPIPTRDDRKAALLAHIEDGSVAGIPLHQLDTREARDAAYLRLAEAGKPAEAVAAFEKAIAYLPTRGLIPFGVSVIKSPMDFIIIELVYNHLGLEFLLFFS